MKFTLITAVSILSTLASGFALPDLVRRATVIGPSIAIVVKSEFPDTPSPPTNMTEVSSDQRGDTDTLLGFVVPACTGRCTISLSDAIAAAGSRTLELFSMSKYPAFGDTWNTGPFAVVQKGTFLVSTTGAGRATVVEDFGLTFDCPTTTTNYGFEVAATWEGDYVIWDITKGGLIITCD